ncbi:MAG: hypothetical protein MUE44_08160 [Oscillatoriaceae cyanobacterium Prado104]|jgi:hypothetical protein|nr:hypothetical protein [Oscillatoriaceae cyanobacterium Prado104]
MYQSITEILGSQLRGLKDLEIANFMKEEGRSKKSEVRSQKSEVRSQKEELIVGSC